ncbi:conserved hypothetical protein [Frankia canadensis]|uniref:CRISPR-associated protein Cas6 C-terminal domain-containing protein n=2 Tax=Frankia canadensis TaxID=1836972 RepID=A0A2I2KIX0_9ACTN|nr:conserved hypothetical protein [Frankia canadensis]SOU52908.1 conserved hypothetical protein [Frankia canadensis]
MAAVTPRQVHGAASGICEVAGSDHHAPVKAFAAGPLLPDESGGGCLWRLGWLGDSALPPGWPPSAVRLGPHTRQVTGFEGHGRSYGELARSGPTRRVRLTMTSPTFFSRNGRDLPMPEPVLVVRNLLTRWNALAPAPLQVGEDDSKALVGGVFLESMSGATRKVELGSGLRQVGFEGSAELRLLKTVPDQAASVFGALARFAEFAGLGAQTAFGFGAVDVELPGLTRSPRSPRREAYPPGV